MAIKIDGKVYRNIQEQVAKNQEDIDDLNHRIPDEPHFYTKEETDALLEEKQETLVSGENIKTINGNSILGAGDIDIVGLIYPVGSIYMSVNSTSPSSLFGGTWEQLKDRFLLGAGDTYSNGSTGGEATHTLTINEMPSHKHTLNGGIGGIEDEGVTPQRGFLGTGRNIDPDNIGSTGGSNPHNNMPPYLVVYMWKRTA